MPDSYFSTQNENFSQAKSRDAEGFSVPDENFTTKIEKFSRAKSRAEGFVSYLGELLEKPDAHDTLGMRKKEVIHRILRKQPTCGDFLHFRHYYTLAERKLYQACFCKQYKTCPLCAGRRGSKFASAYIPVYNQVCRENPSLKAYMVTLTVKDGEDLIERFNHLNNAYKTLQQRRRDSLRGKGNKSIWCKVLAAVGAIETTRGKNSGLWHPHIHQAVLVPAADDFDLVSYQSGDYTVYRCPALEAEWKEITGDSCVVDVRPFSDTQTPEKSFCEIFKYALKFSELSFEDNLHAAICLARRRLVFSYGLFRDVQVDDDLCDTQYEDLPYIDEIYWFISGAGYNLYYVTSPDTTLEAGLRGVGYSERMPTPSAQACQGITTAL